MPTGAELGIVHPLDTANAIQQLPVAGELTDGQRTIMIFVNETRGRRTIEYTLRTWPQMDHAFTRSEAGDGVYIDLGRLSHSEAVIVDALQSLSRGTPVDLSRIHKFDSPATLERYLGIMRTWFGAR